jgi:hypothetical protein
MSQVTYKPSPIGCLDQGPHVVADVQGKESSDVTTTILYPQNSLSYVCTL